MCPPFLNFSYLQMSNWQPTKAITPANAGVSVVWCEVFTEYSQEWYNGNLSLNFWGTIILISTVCCTSLHFHQQYVRVPFLSHPYMHLFAFLMIKYSNWCDTEFLCSFNLPFGDGQIYLTPLQIFIGVPSFENCLCTSLVQLLFE